MNQKYHNIQVLIVCSDKYCATSNCMNQKQLRWLGISIDRECVCDFDRIRRLAFFIMVITNQTLNLLKIYSKLLWIHWYYSCFMQLISSNNSHWCGFESHPSQQFIFLHLGAHKFKIWSCAPLISTIAIYVNHKEMREDLLIIINNYLLIDIECLINISSLMRDKHWYPLASLDKYIDTILRLYRCDRGS